jgi:hypothetical protein
MMYTVLVSRHYCTSIVLLRADGCAVSRRAGCCLQSLWPSWACGARVRTLSSQHLINGFPNKGGGLTATRVFPAEPASHSGWTHLMYTPFCQRAARTRPIISRSLATALIPNKASRLLDALVLILQTALICSMASSELWPEVFKANSEAIFRANTFATTVCTSSESNATDVPLDSAWKDHRSRLEALSEMYRRGTSEARHEMLCHMYDDSYAPDRGLELLIDRASGLEVSGTDGKRLCLARGFFRMPATVGNSEMQLWAFSTAVLEEHESLVGKLPEQTRLQATRGGWLSGSSLGALLVLSADAACRANSVAGAGGIPALGVDTTLSQDLLAAPAPTESTAGDS